MTRGQIARWGLIIVTAGACAFGGAPHVLSQQSDPSRFLVDRWTATFTVVGTDRGHDVVFGREQRTYKGTVSGRVTLVRNPAKDDGDYRVWEGNSTATMQSRETYVDQMHLPGGPVYESTFVESGQVTGLATLKIDFNSMDYLFDVEMGDSLVDYSCSGYIAGYAGRQPYNSSGKTKVTDIPEPCIFGTETVSNLGVSGRLPDGNILSTADGDDQRGHDAQTWSLTPSGPPDWDVVVEPLGYDNWIPTAGVNEKTSGNSIPVVARLKWVGKGTDPKEKATKFVFELPVVSHEPGVCLNWPLAATTDADLQFSRTQPDNISVDSSQDEILKVETNDTTDGYTEASVVISSFDWGAWGTLHVTAEISGGRKVLGHLQGRESYDISLPKRFTNASHIAELWGKKMAVGPAGEFLADDSDADNEPQGADGDEGDGLSLYEEYRGFRVQGRHIRTLPKEKDLFIYDKNLLMTKPGYFGQSHLATHLVNSAEYSVQTGHDLESGSMIVNFNHGWAHLVDQHLIYLKQEVLNGPYGDGGDGPVGPPKTCYAARVDVAHAEKDFGEAGVSWTIAHELGHCISLPHHGDLEPFPTPLITVSALQPDGSTGAASRSDWEIALRGGKYSGVTNCVMRYFYPNFYIVPQAAADFVHLTAQGGTQYLKEFPADAKHPGSKFCSGKEGTELNDPKLDHPVAGNATNGDCAHRICVNDRKH